MVSRTGGLQDKPGESEASTTEKQTFRVGLSTLELCLDFANTLENRLTGDPHETLDHYSDLLTWGRRRGILTEHEAEYLAQDAAHRPEEATSILERTIVLREAIYRIFSVAAGGRAPQPDDLAILNAALATALVSLQVVATGDGFAWAWAQGEQVLDRVAWPVALSAADLLTSSERRAARECAAANCGWLFLDTTRNRSRRWCDMKACGNRAKARRHYERRKVSETAVDRSSRR